jgi:hypothetical protein
MRRPSTIDSGGTETGTSAASLSVTIGILMDISFSQNIDFFDIWRSHWFKKC